MTPSLDPSWLLVAMLCVTVGCTAPGSGAVNNIEGREQRLTVLVGGRALSDDGVFATIDEALSLGLEYSNVGSTGLGFEIGLLGSIGLDENEGVDTGDITGGTAEAYAGLRGTRALGNFRPYAGIGISALAAVIDNESPLPVADGEDFTTGLYVHVGILYDFNSGAFFGFDVRALGGADLEFDTVEGNADYVQAALVFGSRF